MLVEHAEREMRRAGLFDSDADYGSAIASNVLQLIRVFSNQGHSGGSAMKTIQLFHDLVRCKPIGPLTDDPEEWMQVNHDMWQSRRNSSCFSKDGGKTYYDLDEKIQRTRHTVNHMEPRDETDQTRTTSDD